jgi:hypothetical protein
VEREAQFVPSLQQLRQLSEVVMRRHHLTHIRYNSLMWYVSFEFANYYTSPEENTYKKEPDKSIQVPLTEYSKIDFNTYDGKNALIYQIVIYGTE